MPSMDEWRSEVARVHSEYVEFTHQHGPIGQVTEDLHGTAYNLIVAQSPSEPISTSIQLYDSGCVVVFFNMFILTFTSLETALRFILKWTTFIIDTRYTERWLQITMHINLENLGLADTDSEIEEDN